MNAIKQIRKLIESGPDTDTANILSRLVIALAEEKPFALNELYELDYSAFEQALALLQDWRLDRYYAAKLKLMDLALHEVSGKN